MTDLLDAALAHARQGRPVFPCHRDTKRPLLKHGFKEASTEPSVIRNWWDTWPDAMIGMPTGAASGVWVLDVDDPAQFEATCPVTIPPTRRCETGKGFHYYFAVNGSGAVGNAQRTRKGWPFAEMPGAEVRGEGGYVILPPSRHPSGVLYRWSREGEPATAPAELLRIVRKEADAAPAQPRQDPDNGAGSARGPDSAYGLAALEAECAAIRSAMNGAQEMTLNEAGLKIGALVGGEELSRATARRRLIDAGLAMASYNSRDRWTDEVVTAKVDRALSDGAARPRRAPERERQGRDPRQGATASDQRSARPTDETRRPAFTRGISAAALMSKHFEPIRWIVPGYLVEGLTVFAGAPKLGKSWMALDWLLAVAAGGTAMGSIECEQGDVLGLMLEDNERRLQRRLRQLRRMNLPARLTLVTEWPTLDDGCCEEIEAWIAGVENPRLIVVDVFARVKGAKGAKETDYDADYRQAAALQSIASRHNVAVVVIHHTRKMAAEDPFDEVSGTRGLTGAADSVLVLKRDGEQPVLYGRGRDLEEVETAMQFDKGSGGWSILGAAWQVADTSDRREIQHVLGRAIDPLTPTEIATRVGKSRQNVQKMLGRMLEDGHVEQVRRGHYVLVSMVSPVPASSPLETKETKETHLHTRARVVDDLGDDFCTWAKDVGR